MVSGRCDYCDQPAIGRMWTGLLRDDGSVAGSLVLVCRYHADLFNSGDDSMNTLYRMWDSAFDFQRVVLPDLRRWLPPSEFIPIEGSGPRALAVVDTVAGIDGWLVTGTAKLQGVASRVQYGTPWDSFTVRARLPSGAPTELAKRLEALQASDRHYVVPEWTVQAYVTRPRTGFLSLAILVRTQELYRFIADRADTLQRRRNSADETDFIVVWASDLADAGCSVYRVVRPDVGVMRRDGWWYAVMSGTEELVWVPEEVFVEETVKDMHFALQVAMQTSNLALHSREDVLTLADHYYEWLRHRA